MADLTSANAVLLLSLPLLLPVPQQIQDFATDDIFSTAPIVPVEVQMGADGNLSGGYVPREKKTTITLMANSASNDFFDTWASAQDANFTAYQCVGVLTLPTLGRAFALTTGFLTSYVPIADAKKILQARRFEITWQSILGAPVGANG